MKHDLTPEKFYRFNTTWSGNYRPTPSRENLTDYEATDIVNSGGRCLCTRYYPTFKFGSIANRLSRELAQSRILQGADWIYRYQDALILLAQTVAKNPKFDNYLQDDHSPDEGWLKNCASLVKACWIYRISAPF